MCPRTWSRPQRLGEMIVVKEGHVVVSGLSGPVSAHGSERSLSSLSARGGAVAAEEVGMHWVG